MLTDVCNLYKALIFWFFCIKTKERKKQKDRFDLLSFALMQKESNKEKIKALYKCWCF